MNSLIAYCGVDCAACADYQTGACPSCRLTEWGDDPCLPVKCCRERDIALCAYCSEFPCAAMADFYEESDSHRTAYRRMLALRTENR